MTVKLRCSVRLCVGLAGSCINFAMHSLIEIGRDVLQNHADLIRSFWLFVTLICWQRNWQRKPLSLWWSACVGRLPDTFCKFLVRNLQRKTWRACRLSGGTKFQKCVVSWLHWPEQHLFPFAISFPRWCDGIWAVPMAWCLLHLRDEFLRPRCGTYSLQLDESSHWLRASSSNFDICSDNVPNVNFLRCVL